MSESFIGCCYRDGIFQDLKDKSKSAAKCFRSLNADYLNNMASEHFPFTAVLIVLITWL